MRRIRMLGQAGLLAACLVGVTALARGQMEQGALPTDSTVASAMPDGAGLGTTPAQMPMGSATPLTPVSNSVAISGAPAAASVASPLIVNGAAASSAITPAGLPATPTEQAPSPLANRVAPNPALATPVTPAPYTPKTFTPSPATPSPATPNSVSPPRAGSAVVPPPPPSGRVQAAQAPVAPPAAPNPFPGVGGAASGLPMKTSGGEAPAANAEATPPPGGAAPPEAGLPGAEALAGGAERGGKQQLAVSLEWRGAAVAKVGLPADYALVVRNTCALPVEKVQVNVRVPQGLTVAGTQPPAAPEGNRLAWDLGTVEPRQERILKMKLLGGTRGDAAPQACVTFSGSAQLRIHFSEPKLVLKVQAPDKIQTGDPFAFNLVAANPGDGATSPIKIKVALSEGLESSRGNKFDTDIGALNPGESRTVTVLCVAKTGGAQKCEAVAEAEGGLSSQDAAALNIVSPRLALEMTGPALRYLGRKAVYTLKVSNPGDAPATNVTLSNLLPDGFKILAATDGGRHDYQSRTVSWFVGEIGPGQSREVRFEVQAVSPGTYKHRASAAAAGARNLHADAETTTRIEGLSALHLDVMDTEDPIEVNGTTAYKIRLANTGSKTETDIKMVATLPEHMEFVNAEGPIGFRIEGRTLVFDPLARLDPKAEAVIRINVKTLAPGTVGFKIQVTSTDLTEPVIRVEQTRIYSDTEK